MDASAAILGLLNDGEARSMLREDPVVCPHLVDSEVAHALRAQVLRGDVDAADAWRALDTWGRLGSTLDSVSDLAERMARRQRKLDIVAEEHLRWVTEAPLAPPAPDHADGGLWHMDLHGTVDDECTMQARIQERWAAEGLV